MLSLDVHWSTLLERGLKMACVFSLNLLKDRPHSERLSNNKVFLIPFAPKVRRVPKLRLQFWALQRLLNKTLVSFSVLFSFV